MPTLQSPAIIITEELYPSELMGLPPSNLLCVVCQHGSTDSHTAQLLQHEKIPFCMGVFFDFPTIATTAVVDMVNNRIYFEPDLVMRQSLGFEENHGCFEKSSKGFWFSYVYLNGIFCCGRCANG